MELENKEITGFGKHVPVVTFTVLPHRKIPSHPNSLE